MTLRQFLTILRARRWLALSFVFVSLTVAVLLSVLLPKSYTASASVVIDIKSADPIAGTTSVALTAPSYMATQVDIMESDRVALRVVRSLRMTDSERMRSQWQNDTNSQGQFEVWIAHLLQKKLDVKPARESNVIQVSFSAVDPKFAAAVANAFVQAYLDTTIDLRVDSARKYSSFFDERSKKLREDLERAQSRLSAMQKERGILATDERIDVETARLNELSTQLVGIQSVSADSKSRQVAAMAAADTLQDVITNPVVASLRGDLARQEAKLQEMTGRYGDAFPAVIDQRASVSALRSKLEQETQRLSTSVSVTNVINVARESQIRAALEAQRAKVLKLKEERDEVAVLQRDAELAQRAYDGVVGRLTQMSLESQSQQTNASVLMQASEPSKASFPKPAFNIVIGLVVGVLLGIAAAIGREAADRKVRSVEDVARDLRLPVLGTLAGAKRSGWWRRSRAPLTVRILRRLSIKPAPAAA
jgi:chain length determinant protein EpsF